MFFSKIYKRLTDVVSEETITFNAPGNYLPKYGRQNTSVVVAGSAGNPATYFSGNPNYYVSGTNTYSYYYECGSNYYGYYYACGGGPVWATSPYTGVTYIVSVHPWNYCWIGFPGNPNYCGDTYPGNPNYAVGGYNATYSVGSSGANTTIFGITAYGGSAGINNSPSPQGNAQTISSPGANGQIITRSVSISYTNSPISITVPSGGYITIKVRTLNSRN